MEQESIYTYPWEQDFITLLPEDQLEIGQEADKIKVNKEYTTKCQLVRHLDIVMERPFYEVLVMALYFTSNSELQNEIVDLI